MDKASFLIKLVAVLVLMSVPVQGQSTMKLIASPTLTVSYNITNSSINTNYTGNFSSIQPNLTTIIPYVTPSIISPVSNITATAENVFFIEFKLLSKQWNDDLSNKDSEDFIILSNEVTKQINKVYGQNDTNFNGSLVLGFRDGVYVTIKVEYNRTVVVNTSFVDPLIDFFRSGGSRDFATDRVFFKISKHADCIITYVETKSCQCKTKTYNLQIKCHQPDLIGGEPCPQICYSGQQVVGMRPCSWDDLDAFLCSSCVCQPNVKVVTMLALMTFFLNMYVYNNNK